MTLLFIILVFLYPFIDWQTHLYITFVVCISFVLLYIIRPTFLPVYKHPPSHPLHRSVLLDILRTIGIGLVVWSHISLHSGMPLEGGLFGKRDLLFNELYNGVPLFLMISGLSLELSYRRKTPTYWQFLKGRLLRLYPVYWMSLVYGIAAYFLLKYLQGKPLDCPECGIVETTCSVFGMCALVGKWGGPFLVTGWFIGLILLLYLIYPSISQVMRKSPAVVLAFFICVSALSRLVLIHDDQILPYWAWRWFPLSRISEFALGIYLAQVLPEQWWGILNRFTLPGRIFSFISLISFPLFLVHFPLLPYMGYFFYKGVNYRVAIVGFLIVSMGVSVLIHTIDIKTSRRKVL